MTNFIGAEEFRKKIEKSTANESILLYFNVTEGLIWGLFDRASSSWNKVKCQLDKAR